MIPPEAAAPWHALCTALDHLADEGWATPCQGRDSHLWTSEDRDEREAASWRCDGCRVIHLCKTYADDAGEPFGVWAGVDRTTTRGNKTT